MFTISQEGNVLNSDKSTLIPFIKNILHHKLGDKYNNM